MQIRKYEKGEWEQNLISVVSFHRRVEDLEEEKKQWLQEADTADWGAFTRDGTPMARILNRRVNVRMDGGTVCCGCVGAVSTLPEYRNTGAIRQIFEKMLQKNRREGELISTLYPFNHGFYRKFGYEVAPLSIEYDLPTTALKGYRHEGWARLWKPGEARDAYLELYNRFAEGLNLSFVRDSKHMEERINGQYYKDRRFCYLLGRDETPQAYVVFQDVRQEPQAKLKVEDIAYDGYEGMMALLGFLSRFSADYKNIVIALPDSVNLLKLLDEPYDCKTAYKCDYMVRIIHLPRLLQTIRKPEHTAFTLRAVDELLPENNQTWLVENERVTETQQEPDMVADIRALSQLVTGISDLQEAILRPDVQVRHNRALLERVFTKKPCFVADYF